MENITINSTDTLALLVEKAHETTEPVAVFEGDDECMVVMSPAVFERILFDTHLLNCEDRQGFLL